LENWDRRVFKYFEGMIASAGVREQFTLRGRTSTYVYYYAGDGFKYWIMGEILNRCPGKPPV